MKEQIISAINSHPLDSRISIDYNMVRHLAKKWISEPFALPPWDSPIGMDHNLELASAYYFFGNCINFGFYPEHDNLGPVGNVRLWLALRSHPELLEPSALIHLTKEYFVELFGNQPLIEERLSAWQDTARILRRKYNGKVTEFYEVNHWNAPEIIQTLDSEFPAFRDNPVGIPFARRAQLTLFMTHARFQESMLFSNLHKLSVGADLQVFNGLLQLGVLEISDDFRQFLAAQALLAGEEPEISIRCLTILGADLLLNEINASRRQKIGNCQLDYYLRRLGTNGKAPLPLALSTAY